MCTYINYLRTFCVNYENNFCNKSSFNDLVIFSINIGQKYKMIIYDIMDELNEIHKNNDILYDFENFRALIDYYYIMNTMRHILIYF